MSAPTCTGLSGAMSNPVQPAVCSQSPPGHQELQVLAQTLSNQTDALQESCLVWCVGHILPRFPQASFLDRTQVRMLNNLRRVYLSLKDPERCLRIQQYLRCALLGRILCQLARVTAPCCANLLASQSGS